MKHPNRARALFSAAGGELSMRTSIGYRFLMMGLSLGLGVVTAAGIAKAQEPSKVLSESDLYCTGVATDQPVPADKYLISGENSAYKNTFQQGDHVYINQGTDQGVKIGDLFEVVRPVGDPMADTWFKLQPHQWFKWQSQLAHSMGTMYTDIGQVRVIRVQSKISIAELKLTCDLMQRGDIIRPLTVRPAPAYHATMFDPFAPPSGKKTAMIVITKHYGQIAGAGAIVFVNLGSAQGVQVGDYFRVFRYQGTRNDTIYQIKNTAYQVYGYGSAPAVYQWDNLPRQVLGEGLVLRTGPNSATVLLTIAREEIYDGDYVEVE
jgi:hypothetical protein